MKLTPSEALILKAFLDGYDDHASLILASGAKTVGNFKVHLHRLRKKIAPFEIRSDWGKGYKIAPEQLEQLRALWHVGMAV